MSDNDLRFDRQTRGVTRVMCHTMCTRLGETLMKSPVERISMLAAVAIFAIACGPFHHGGGPPDPVVVFRNDSPDQADVYAIGSSAEPMRIGTVFAGKSETLRLPLSVVGGANRV